MLLRILILIVAGVMAACVLSPSDYNGAGAPREAAIQPLRSERPLVGLALGSGGARGFAHIGVIKALEEAGIVPDVVTGSSSGAVVGALYAAGRGASDLEEIALRLEQGELVDLALLGNGWVKGEALQNFVNRQVDGRPLERLARPFAVVATEAKSGRMVVFNRGDTGVAVRASASVPNMFVPPVINGEEYVDGGLTSPVPVKLARAMGADVVIAVDVSWFAQARDPSGPAMNQYGRSGRYALLADELGTADVVIAPRTVRTRMLDFGQKESNIAAGEAAGREAVPRLREMITLAQGATAPGGFAGEEKDWGVSPTARLRAAGYHSPTPLKIPGGRVVTTAQLKSLMEREPRPYLIDVLGGGTHRTVAGAFWMSGAGAGDLSKEEESRFARAVGNFAAGDKARPLVFFCADAECWLSYNAALRAIALGYTNIMWYRGGVSAWGAAGLPMSQSEPFYW